MARTVVDIDDEALAAAAAVLGTTTRVDTVRALAEIAARPHRLAALERLRTTVDDLDDTRVMRGECLVDPSSAILILTGTPVATARRRAR